MKLFEREDTDSPFYYEDLPDDVGTLGTPCHRSGQELRTFLEDLEGFEPDADFYIYIIILERVIDSSTWYYVGKASGEDQLKDRFSKHIRDFTQSRPVRQHGEDVLKGEGGGLHYVESEQYRETGDREYRATGVERVAAYHFDNMGFDEDAGKWGSKHAWNQQKITYVKEKEREMSYIVALNHSTTNVLGGK